MLGDAEVPSLLVDRYRFREMLDSTAGGEFWPKGAVAVLSRDFARQPDIQDSLANASWDLVIANEAHSFTGTRAEVLRRIGASAERIILAGPLDFTPLDSFPAEEATVVEWRRDRVVDHNGKRLDMVPRPVLHEVSFSLSEVELRLRSIVRDLCDVLRGTAGMAEQKATTLLRNLESSPAALEGVLQRLTEGILSQDGMDALLEVSEEEKPEDRPCALLDRPTAEKVAEIARRALQEVDAIGSDSKLNAFSELLNHLDKSKMPSRRICVLTEYLATLYYLAAETEGRGIVCRLFHGGMQYEDRRERLTVFANTGGVLIATRAVMTEGLNLPDVTDLVLYDLPANERALQVVLGRFDRFGKTSQLTVHALVESDGTVSALLESLRRLHDMGSRR